MAVECISKRMNSTVVCYTYRYCKVRVIFLFKNHLIIDKGLNKSKNTLFTELGLKMTGKSINTVKIYTTKLIFNKSIHENLNTKLI